MCYRETEERKKESAVPIFLLLFAVTVRLSARGAYLLLLPQGRAPVRDWALIQDRALISFLRNNWMFKTEKGTITETVSVTNIR